MVAPCDLTPPTVILLPEQWPDADAAGVTHLPPEIAARLFGTLKSVANFVEAYRARCTETGD